MLRRSRDDRRDDYRVACAPQVSANGGMASLTVIILAHKEARYIECCIACIGWAVARVAAVLTDPGVDVVFGNGAIIGDYDRQFSTAQSSRFSSAAYGHGAMTFIAQGCCFRATAFARAGAFIVANRTCWDGELLIDLVPQRTIECIGANGAVEDFDLAIIRYFQTNPLDLIAGVGLGNAHHFAQRYIDPEFQWYALGRVVTAKMQYLLLISEIGFIGLGPFLMWYLVLVIDVAVVIRQIPALAPVMPMATMTIVIFFASRQFIGEFYHMAGKLAALCAVANRTRTSPPNFATLAGAAAR